MVQRNQHLSKLKAGYLFPEINRFKREVIEQNPDAHMISLGIGDTTEPVSPHITQGLMDAAKGLGTRNGYTGYGAEQGMGELRAKIATVFYNDTISPEEVFVSDGAKCDIGRLQILFGAAASLAVQDPSYPVYVDGSVMIGATGGYDDTKKQFQDIVYMTCRPENHFFPDLGKTPRTDLIYFCSPNNPTGVVATRDQLKDLIAFAKKNKSIIIFDAAYAKFISEEHLPKSIFEIKGARDVAIEVNSFSKIAGFTGVRLGWSIVPRELCYDDGHPVIQDWNRVMSTIFNGASNLAQMGGMAALDDEGLDELRSTVRYYMDNARMIKEALDAMGMTTYGGKNAPYVWAEFPGQDSWDIFRKILAQSFVVTTPGSGFGPGGEGFIRLSAFGHRSSVEEAVARLQKVLAQFV